jgi:hypothetical protein
MLFVTQVSRVYASFAEFDRAERRRLGQPESEPAQLTVSELVPDVEARAGRAAVSHALSRVTLATLRAEGVLEIGRAAGTSVLFVRTRVKIHLLHVTALPDRELDDYAVQLAVTWIDEHGLPGHAVARNLGVGEETLRKALARAGYERALAWRYTPRASRGRGGRGNRSGGRLKRVRDVALQTP